MSRVLPWSTVYLLAAVLAAAAVGLLWYDHSRTRVPRIPQGSVVVLFGDSLAQGLATPLRAQAAASGVQMYADAVPGTRFDQWMARGPSFASSKGATFAIISLGTNDAVANEAHRATLPARARAISGELRSRGVVPIWVLPPPMRFSTEAPRQAILATGDAALESLDYPRYDSIHPTPAGFHQWASDIWAVVGPR